MDTDLINGIYAQFPENDYFDSSIQFDAFLVGEGSNQIFMKKPSKSFFESFSDESDTKLEVIHDFDLFAVEDSEVEDYEELFFQLKKNCLNQFNFIEEKSKRLKGVPVKEKDLVLNSDDSYLLYHLKTQGNVTRHTLEAIASLSACLDMGIPEVKFYEMDGCALCKAYDGTIFSVKDLISRIGARRLVIHAGAKYNFIPVIRDRKVFDHIQNGFTLSAYIDDVYFRHLPLEFVEFITTDLVQRLSYKEVCFIDFDVLSSIVPNLNIESDEVVLSQGDFLFVKNSYVFNYSPYDFLINWLNSKVDDSSVIDNFEDDEVLYLNGYRVVERNGKYIDVQTNEVVDEQ